MPLGAAVTFGITLRIPIGRGLVLGAGASVPTARGPATARQGRSDAPSVPVPISSSATRRCSRSCAIAAFALVRVQDASAASSFQRSSTRNPCSARSATDVRNARSPVRPSATRAATSVPGSARAGQMAAVSRPPSSARRSSAPRANAWTPVRAAQCLALAIFAASSAGRQTCRASSSRHTAAGTLAAAQSSQVRTAGAAGAWVAGTPPTSRSP